MRFGLVTPIVTNLTGAHARWEETAGIEDLATVARAADRLGYDHLTCSEHVGLPAAEASRRGARYWDPLATFGYIASVTTRIRLATFVLVLGYHHPLEIVKRYGTLDLVSGGRVTLGVGVGSLEEEFELLGVPFDDRGERAEEALQALRVSLSTTTPSYAGKYYEFGGLLVDPCAVQARVPIWVGGRSLRSLRRAVTYGDGWCPFNVSPTTAADWLGRFDLPEGFDVVLSADGALDPAGSPEQVGQTITDLAAGGVTVLSARFVHHSAAHYLEQMEALAELRHLLD